jgi:HEAT repeat protein
MVVTASDLLGQHLAGLKDANPTRCVEAIYGLGELAPYSDKVVPALAGMLAKGKNEEIRQAAAWSLGQIGVMARAALPALKAGLGDPNENVRTAFRSAVEQIEKAKDEPGWREEFKRRIAILKDLDEWKKARRK